MAQESESGKSKSGGGSWLLLGMILAAVCLLMRGMHVMVLPIFGDEAIYLRWAQLVRGEGVDAQHWWVSLTDPKPPLHFWLMAAVFRWSRDPLLAARMISVVAGALSMPLMMAVGRELGHLLREKPAGKPPLSINGVVWGLVAAVLALFCPFLAFYQRFATADGLFVMESLLVVWLSLRWGRVAGGGGEREHRGWWVAFLLGGAMGVALMTRQGISYTLCVMPVIAWLLHGFWKGRAMPPARQRIREPIVQLVMIGLVAGVIWTPFLTAELRQRALAVRNEVKDQPDAPVTVGQMLAEVKRRIFYQEKLTQSSEPRSTLVSRNLMSAFIPQWRDGRATSGWLYLYLTPVVYVLCLGGLIYLLLGRQWRVWILLSMWILVTVGPVIALGNLVYSRYVLAGVPPLLFAGAYALAGATAVLQRPKQPVLAWLAVIVLWLGVLAWPVREIGFQATQYWRQSLTAQDQYQYITGWTAGLPTREAITFLRALAQQGPIVVITDNGWGTPADGVWAYLAGNPNVRLYFTDDMRVLRRGTHTGMYRLKDDKWLFPKEREVPLLKDQPVLYITGAVAHRDGEPDQSAEQLILRQNPNLELAKTFEGMVIDGKRVGEGVLLFKVVLP